VTLLDVRTEILDIAQKYLTRVRPSGAENVMALCPFHEDNTASFAMNITNGVYFCHACHAKGNLYTFLRGVGVNRATIDMQYKELIEEARSATPPGPDPMDPGVYSLKPIPEAVLGHFDGWDIPQLLNAGFRPETLRHFDVGFDKWHGRVTHPIRDLKGDLVGISGRTIYSGVKPRYKLYNKEYPTWGVPERGDWDRRKILYNAHNVIPALVTYPSVHAPLVVVEGFKACMWVWQLGMKNVVGLLGSYLSWEQRWILEKFKGVIYFLLDNNDPGRLGTFDACKALLLRTGGRDGRPDGSTVEVRVIEYPERLRDDEDAQPDCMTSDEFWEQFFAAKSHMHWVQETLGFNP